MKSSNMIKPYDININQLRREFSSTNSVTEVKKTERQNEEKINQNETKIFEKKNKLFNFDINLVRNNYYKKPNESKYENEFSSTNSVTEDKRTEKENEQNKINSNEVTTISNEKLMNISNYTEEQIPIDYIKNNFEDFKENLSTNDKTEKSVNKNPTKPTYYIPFRKIFKEDNKKIDIDELQFNDNKKKEKSINNPVENISKKKEENKILNKEKSNFNTNFIKPDFSGDNKNEYNSQNFLNMQNNSNNVWGYFKIIEEEKKFNQLLQIGLISLLNDGNLNNYLLPLFINNSIIPTIRFL
jgi:hypothetical protein